LRILFPTPKKARATLFGIAWVIGTVISPQPILAASAEAKPSETLTARKDVNLKNSKIAAAYQVLAAKALPATLAVAVILPDGNVEGVNTDKPMPMQSVFKAPLAAAVFDAAEHGLVDLDATVTLTRSDLSCSYSPVADNFPKRTDYTIRQLVEAAVEQSDNSAADYLMKKIGGPTVVTRFLRQHGIDHIRVDRYEHEIQPASVGLPKFHGQWIGSEALDEAKAKIPLAQQKKGFATYLADARDKLTARGGAEFMRKLTAGKLLNKDSSNELLAILKAAVTGKGRIHAGLPSNAILAHKTGTGATVDGVCCASNDVGIVFLPDGTQFEIAVLLSGSALTPADQDKIMAAAAKIAVSHVVQPSRSN